MAPVSRSTTTAGTAGRPPGGAARGRQAAVATDGSGVKINDNGRHGWALAGGGAVDPDGGVHFASSGYEQNGELDIDGRGRTQAVGGEGFDYGSPGSIWYARGR